MSLLGYLKGTDMQVKRHLTATLIAVLSVPVAGAWNTAEADLQTFTDPVAWQAAVGQTPIQVEDFSNSPLGNLSAGITDAGAFSVFIDSSEVPAPIYYTRIEDFLNNRRFVGCIFPPGPYPGVREMRFVFDAPIIGFAGEWSETIDDDQLTITINGVKRDFSDFLSSGHGNGFLGFLDPARPFSSVVIGINNASAFSEGELFVLDNVRLAAAPPSGSGSYLSVVKSGTGSGTVTSKPAGINCGTVCAESFTEGTAVTLTATSGGSSTFTGWSGACTGKGPCVVVMDAAKAVVASFALASGPPRVPSAPSGLTATAVSRQQVQLTWRDNSTNEDTFRVEVKRGQQGFREVAIVSANETRIVLSNLLPGTRYVFRVRARNAAGFSRYSNQAAVRTPR
jgi:hypothetical protein